MDIFGKLGQLIHRQRTHQGLSRIALAEKAGVGKTVVYDVEKGKASVQFDTLTKILRALNIQLRFCTDDLMISFKE